MPSAIVSAGATSTGLPRSSDAGNAATVSTWTPTTSTSGRARLDRDRDAAASPPPPTGTTTFARSGDVLEQLEPERALAGDDVRVVERVHERHAGLARALARDRDALVDALAARGDRRAERRRALDLRDRRVGAA